MVLTLHWLYLYFFWCQLWCKPTVTINIFHLTASLLVNPIKRSCVQAHKKSPFPAVLWFTLLYATLHCSTLQCSKIQCSTIQISTIYNSTIRCIADKYSCRKYSSLCTVQCTVDSVQWTGYTVHWQWTQFTVHCTVHWSVNRDVLLILPLFSPSTDYCGLTGSALLYSN